MSNRMWRTSPKAVCSSSSFNIVPRIRSSGFGNSIKIVCVDRNLLAPAQIKNDIIAIIWYIQVALGEEARRTHEMGSTDAAFHPVAGDLGFEHNKSHNNIILGVVVVVVLLFVFPTGPTTEEESSWR
jgi:hypothetical protein